MKKSATIAITTTTNVSFVSAKAFFAKAFLAKFNFAKSLATKFKDVNEEEVMELADRITTSEMTTQEFELSLTKVVTALIAEKMLAKINDKHTKRAEAALKTKTVKAEQIAEAAIEAV